MRCSKVNKKTAPKHEASCGAGAQINWAKNLFSNSCHAEMITLGVTGTFRSTSPELRPFDNYF